MGTIILYSVLLVLVIFAGLWFIQHSQFRNEEKKRQFELKRESQKSVSPIRLRAYERLTLLLAIFIAAVLVGVVIDVLCRTSDGVHMDPAPVVEAAETFWKEHSDKPIPVAVGGLRFAALLDHYSKQHPPVCEPDDEVMIDLYREKIRKHGALLIDAGEKDFDEFLKRAGAKVAFRRVQIKFGSRFGKRKTRWFVLGYLPPGTEIK